MRTKLFLVVPFLCLVTIPLPSNAQRTAQVYAYQAPDCTTSSMECKTFIQSVLPYISGIGHVFRWADLDASSASCSPTCTFYPSYTAGWSEVAAFFNAYINNTNYPLHKSWTNGCVNGSTCKIMLIFQPETDGMGANVGFTPTYVFGTAYSTAIGAPGPQDIAACSQFTGSGSLPYTGSLASTNDAVVWNANTCSVAACTTTPACPVSCGTSNLSNTTGFPVVYEQPIMSAYQAFLQSFSTYFNSSSGTYSGVGEYIKYVRAGLSVGGENYPVCEAVNGSLSLPKWFASTAYPAGLLVTPTTNNTGGYTFLSLNAGTTGATAPSWNQTPGNTTTNDNGIMWENEGVTPVGADGGTPTPVWPGPKGLASQPNDYQDNGYLSHWAGGVGTTGYVSQMVSFLASLDSTFSWDIATNFGPQRVISYPDADAVLAYAEGGDKVGFGMESLSVQDPVTLLAGVFPTSREDWIANFANYSAPSGVPVHHLQTNTPGTEYLAAGYTIDTIAANSPSSGNAEIYCGTGIDCSWFYGMWVYITGDTYDGTGGTYNGPWASPCTGEGSYPLQCPPDYMVITPTLPLGGAGGIVWSPNYWPKTLQFSANNGATVLEVYECDLDFAFGVMTTAHTAPGGSAGCSTDGITTPTSGYTSTLSSVQ